jgi:transposase
MPGPLKPRRLDDPITVSLEDLVPRDHFGRHLKPKLDLSFVRKWTMELYAERGPLSISPSSSSNCSESCSFEGIRSERQLMRVVADRLSLGWYLGDDLTEPLPDHPNLPHIRERYALTVVRGSTLPS